MPWLHRFRESAASAGHCAALQLRTARTRAMVPTISNVRRFERTQLVVIGMVRCRLMIPTIVQARLSPSLGIGLLRSIDAWCGGASTPMDICVRQTGRGEHATPSGRANAHAPKYAPRRTRSDYRD